MIAPFLSAAMVKRKETSTCNVDDGGNEVTSNVENGETLASPHLLIVSYSLASSPPSRNPRQTHSSTSAFLNHYNPPSLPPVIQTALVV